MRPPAPVRWTRVIPVRRLAGTVAPKHRTAAAVVSVRPRNLPCGGGGVAYRPAYAHNGNIIIIIITTTLFGFLGTVVDSEWALGFDWRRF